MVEIIVRKLYVDAEYKKGLTCAAKVRDSMITTQLDNSEGAFADKMNNTIKNLNNVFAEIASAMEQCNSDIKNANDEFARIDEFIADSLEVITGAFK